MSLYMHCLLKIFWLHANQLITFDHHFPVLFSSSCLIRKDGCQTKNDDFVKCFGCSSIHISDANFNSYAAHPLLCNILRGNVVWEAGGITFDLLKWFELSNINLFKHAAWLNPKLRITCNWDMPLFQADPTQMCKSHTNLLTAEEDLWFHNSEMWNCPKQTNKKPPTSIHAHNSTLNTTRIDQNEQNCYFLILDEWTGHCCHCFSNKLAT